MLSKKIRKKLSRASLTTIIISIVTDEILLSKEPHLALSDSNWKREDQFCIALAQTISDPLFAAFWSQIAEMLRLGWSKVLQIC